VRQVKSKKKIQENFGYFVYNSNRPTSHLLNMGFRLKDLFADLTKGWRALLVIAYIDIFTQAFKGRYFTLKTLKTPIQD